MENKKLPSKAVSALVYGILSVFFSFCFISFFLTDYLLSSSYSSDFVGELLLIVTLYIPVIIFAVLGLNKSQKGYIAVNKNPELYRGVGMLKAARITSYSYVGAFSTFAPLILLLILRLIILFVDFI